jgi:hypothetical protein
MPWLILIIAFKVLLRLDGVGALVETTGGRHHISRDSREAVCRFGSLGLFHNI